jgi:hypothetical protein
MMYLRAPINQIPWSDGLWRRDVYGNRKQMLEQDVQQIAALWFLVVSAGRG